MEANSERSERFRRLCRDYGIAVTHQRQIIYETLISCMDHPTPEWIYEHVHKQLPSISLATVYKCLHTFVNLGLVKEASRHHGSVRVDPNLRPHHHLFCKVCGMMMDVDETEVDSPGVPSRLPRGFRVETTEVEFVGTCAACQKTGPVDPG
jgi:Fur family peroxide stress response transcriptional regulator